ncbi:MAG: ThuA domain-containing protein [Clostridia bacterium]|nr:ThuA domain-containing protein [Clostridia bacterium]
MEKKINITIFNENYHDSNDYCVRHYPNGMHNAIKKGLEVDPCFNITIATQDMEECGLTDEVINNTDVMFWWGHIKHNEVPDHIVNKVHQRVLKGMGLVVLHSGHFSKIFKKLMGTGCDLKWRCSNDKERFWCVNPSHPIANGIPQQFTLDQEEMYGEHFDIPAPDELVFISWFSGGEVFRSGCTFRRGNGKIFYFRPGHESCPSYNNEYVLKVLRNAAHWACPAEATFQHYGKFDSLENPEVQ